MIPCFGVSTLSWPPSHLATGQLLTSWAGDLKILMLGAASFNHLLRTDSITIREASMGLSMAQCSTVSDGEVVSYINKTCIMSALHSSVSYRFIKQ